ncbi:hypothetical protein QE152_g9091 [Popillia japonica]|uniref:Uncharacterized protein n=1 Tax=Popillia japonica TaxID=7064 RepID=A0AAW1LZX4_POPJA
MNLNTVIKEKEEKLFGFENNSKNMDNNNNCDVIKNIQSEYKKLEDKFNQFSTTTSRRRLQQEEHLKQISDDYKPSNKKNTVQTSQFQRALDESEERFQENTRKLNAAHEKNISDFQKAMKSIRRRLQQEEHLKQISDDYKPSVQTSQFQRALDESEERFQENTRKLNAAHEKNISDFQKAMKSIKPKVEALQNSVQSRADVLIREIKYLSNNLNSMELIEQCQQILPKKKLMVNTVGYSTNSQSVNDIIWNASGKVNILQNIQI